MAMEADGVRPVVLAIDWGSTCVRVALYDPSDDFLEIVGFESNDLFRRTMSAWNYNELPACGQPYQAPYNVGEMAYNAPGSESLKKFLYALTGEADLLRVNIGVLRGVPPLRLSEMLVKFFARVRKHVDNYVRDHNMEYKRIGLTVPSFWGKPFQDHYDAVVSHVWKDWKDTTGTAPDSISFVTEIEAQAHYIIRTMPHKLEDAEEVLFIDLGGHSMGGCRFCLHWLGANDRNPTFYEDGLPFGETGGEEIFGQLIGKDVEAELNRRGYRDARDRERCKSSLMQDFHREKVNLEADLMSPVTLLKDSQNELTLSADIVHQRQREAYKKILESVTRNSRRMTKNFLGVGNSSIVVFTGGSFQSLKVQEDMLNIAGAGGLTPVFLGAHDTTMICKGAALALGRRLTVLEFIGRGAGFGIRVGDRKTASVIEIQQNSISEPVKITLARRAELKLVCDPLYNMRNQLPVLCKYCYDLHSLGMRSRGIYEVQIRWNVSEDGDSAFELLERQLTGDSDSSMHVLKLPLYFDGGNNCCHVDIDILEK